MKTLLRVNRFTRVALGFALLSLCAILSAQDVPETSGPTNFSGAFKIAGVVVSEASGAPLARTRVIIFDTTNGRNMLWMITAEDGRFEFNNLAAGKYSLQGARRGTILHSHCDWRNI